MAIVLIQASPLSTAQKKRIGEGVLRLLHQEGISAASTVLLFKAEDADLYLEGGFFHEASASVAPKAEAKAEPGAPPAPPKPAPLNFLPAGTPKGTSRPTKAERAGLKIKLVQALQIEGALSSFEAQTRLGLKDSDWAPNTLRRFFSELEEEGLITKQGQKRGTRYLWKGIVQTASPTLPPVKLVKKSPEEEN